VGNGDLFAQDGSEDGGVEGTGFTQVNESVPVGLEELPIELVSLTDRYVLDLRFAATSR
jgi:hypothetical protein